MSNNIPIQAPPPLAPHDYWQRIHPAGSFTQPATGWDASYPAALPDGRQIVLPVRVLPGDGTRAVASLIVNQASFAVLDALSETLTAALRPHAPEVVIGVPTLGLPLAEGVARRLGHERAVALGTSRKFWYSEDLSVPMSSITSPDQVKRLYIDPRMLPLLAGRRVALVDDVASSGRTLRAVLKLLEMAEIKPVALAFAMLQGQGWRGAIADGPWPDMPVLGAIATPRLQRGADGFWLPEDTE